MTDDEVGGPADRSVPEQMQVRVEKVDRMRAAGVDPYPVGYPRTHTIAEVRSEFGELPADATTGKVVGVAAKRAATDP